jgi:hypothetical protein
MPVQLSAANQAVTARPLDIITSAYREAGIIDAIEPPSAEEAAWGLEKLQRAFDQHNARRELVFNVSFSLFNLLANHGPHTIGPGGDFNVPIRPVTIVSAAFVLNGGSANPVDRDINMRDDAWWAANPLKSQRSSIVTDLYYSPDSPVGNLNFYPICTVVAPVRLQMWNALPQAIDLQTPLALVQGYWDAIVLDLAVKLCNSFEKPVSPDLRDQWQRAMRIIEANNDKPPRIDTAGGMPNSNRGGRPDFNFLTGMRE